jgi:hypothetical protein
LFAGPIVLTLASLTPLLGDPIETPKTTRNNVKNLSHAAEMIWLYATPARRIRSHCSRTNPSGKTGGVHTVLVRMREAYSWIVFYAVRPYLGKPKGELIFYGSPKKPNVRSNSFDRGLFTETGEGQPSVGHLDFDTCAEAESRLCSHSAFVKDDVGTNTSSSLRPVRDCVKAMVAIYTGMAQRSTGRTCDVDLKPDRAGDEHTHVKDFLLSLIFTSQERLSEKWKVDACKRCSAVMITKPPVLQA